MLFHKWDLCIRLDIWHYMQRIAVGCTTKSHPLYGSFMSQLSSAIFEWDKEDFEHLTTAKNAEMIAAGIPNPFPSVIQKAISQNEMSRHCRRRTRGVKQTTEAIEHYFFNGHLYPWCTSAKGRDQVNLGRAAKACSLRSGSSGSRAVHNILKGGVMLPVVRCARGSTSLESFHLHLAHLVPGHSAAAVNFQAYILDGITRWNAARSLQQFRQTRMKSFAPTKLDYSTRYIQISTVNDVCFF